eukprot:PhM_4_TR9514/c0_g1_i1/m.60960
MKSSTKVLAVAFVFGVSLLIANLSFSTDPVQPEDDHDGFPQHHQTTAQLPAASVEVADGQGDTPKREPGVRSQIPTPSDVNHRPVALEAELSCVYPVHKNLAKPSDLSEAIRRQMQKDASKCVDMTAHRPMPDTPSSYGQTSVPPKHGASFNSAELQREFRFVSAKPFFVDVASDSFMKETIRDGESDVWWAPASNNIPCTAAAQRALFRHQHPTSCGGAKFLSTRLKEGAHGLGSALSIVVYDFLSAIMTGRVLHLESGPWYFASGACAQLGWQCYFAPPSSCAPPPGSGVHTVNSLREAKSSSSKTIRKKALDIPGLGRNDLPSVATFFGNEKCTEMDELEQWLRNPENNYLMGTFAKGSDPYLTWLMAQVMRYLVRMPHPWFSEMLHQNLAQVGYPQEWTKPLRHDARDDNGPGSSEGVVFVQLRGEIAKYREYYNVFGCHDVHIDAYVSVSHEVAPNAAMFISGNTPHHRYDYLVRNAKAPAVFSTWNHTSMRVASGGAKETLRWGADSLMASWLDFFAGVAASGWVCIVQSNWCRMINFLRMTAGRAQCPFVDLGVLMVADASARRQYCIVKPEWPKKPFGGFISCKK